jgi:Transposase DDE domain
MPGIIEFPTIVQQALKDFGDLFDNEPARRHFAEYLTGLLVAARKTVNGINAEFAVTTDQSCLNRWMTEVGWDYQALNVQRLAWLQCFPDTRYAAHGVIPIDNVLIEHAGQFIEDAGWLWDHAEQRPVIAHDYLIANYVCPSGKHYALEFRRFRKQEDCDFARQCLEAAPGGIAAALPEQVRLSQFKDHTQLCQELVDWVVAQEIPGDFTFDCYFTSAAVLNHIHHQQRAYVGELKFNRKVWFQGQEMHAADVAALLASDDRQPVQVGDKRYWYFTKTIRIAEVDHLVRRVILWERKNGKEPVKMLITNRTFWEVTRILRVYRHRWTGTETLHRDGKQSLGMGDCQLRSGEGQTRHMSLVLLVHSWLMVQLRQGRAREWATTTLMTLGEACRAVLRETLRKTITWAIDRAAQDHWQIERITTHLALA